jgi:hypothetical protein
LPGFNLRLPRRQTGKVPLVLAWQATVLKEAAMNPIVNDEEIDEKISEVLRIMPWGCDDDLDQLPFLGIGLSQEPPVDSRPSSDADEAGESEAELGWPQSGFVSELEPIPDEDHACNI